MIRAEALVEDRAHDVIVTIDGRGLCDLTPAQALRMAADLAGSTDMGAREFATELVRAAEPPQVCDRCHDRNAHLYDRWCAVCAPDDLDGPRDAA